MKIKNNNHGITLIALVVTIIVIIILATISINGVLELIDRVKLEESKIYNAIHEGDVQINNYYDEFPNIPDNLIINGVDSDPNPNTNTVDPDQNTNTVDPEPPVTPEPDTTKPTVKVSVTSTGYDTISVKVTATDTGSGLGTNPVYKYSIKKSSANTDYLSYTTSVNSTMTFNDLKQDEKYDIQVKVKDTANNEGEGTTTGTTALCHVCEGSGEEEQEQLVACHECKNGAIFEECNTCTGSGDCLPCGGDGLICDLHGSDTVQCQEECWREGWVRDCECTKELYITGKCVECKGDGGVYVDCSECEDGYYYDTVNGTCSNCEGAGCN